MSAARVEYLGLNFDRIDSPAVLKLLADRPARAPFAYVVTPNVDHIVRLHADPPPADAPAIWAAYRHAAWCICDSRILAAVARAEGIDLPVVPGSDLTVAVLSEVCKPGDRIAIVGGSAATAAALGKRYPELEVLHHAPPMGLRQDRVAIQAAAAFVAVSDARFVFLAVGSPQQELLAMAITEQGDATGTGLCVGAAIEFVVGESRRAPRIVQKLHLEWAFRLAQDPKRMWRRYLVSGPRIFALARKDRRSRKTPR